VNTETTQTNDTHAVRGWIFFDADCRACVTGRERLGAMFESRGYRWLPLQTPGAAARLGVSETELRAEMRLQLADGQVFGGIDTWVHLWRSVWWLWPLGVLASLPGVHSLAGALYRWVARNRYCFSGRCVVTKGSIP